MILGLFLLCIIEYFNGLRMTILTSCSYFRFYFDWFVKTQIIINGNFTVKLEFLYKL